MDLNLGYTQDIIKVAKDKGLLRNELAYVLATAYHETAHTMKPVKEAYWLSEDWRKKNLRYYPWYGRGFVQLTWEVNYKRASQEIGVDLVKNKDLALDPKIAAVILVIGMVEGWFVPGQTLSKYFTVSASNYTGARRIINGVDKKDEVADWAKKYEKDLIASGYGVDKPQKSIQTIPVVPAPIVPVESKASTAPAVTTPSGVTWGSVLELLIKAFKK